MTAYFSGSELNPENVHGILNPMVQDGPMVDALQKRNDALIEVAHARAEKIKKEGEVIELKGCKECDVMDAEIERKNKESDADIEIKRKQANSEITRKNWALVFRIIFCFAAFFSVVGLGGFLIYKGHGSVVVSLAWALVALVALALGGASLCFWKENFAKWLFGKIGEILGFGR